MSQKKYFNKKTAKNAQKGNGKKHTHTHTPTTRSAEPTYSPSIFLVLFFFKFLFFLFFLLKVYNFADWKGGLKKMRKDKGRYRDDREDHDDGLYKFPEE